MPPDQPDQYMISGREESITYGSALFGFGILSFLLDCLQTGVRNLRPRGLLLDTVGTKEMGHAGEMNDKQNYFQLQPG